MESRFYTPHPLLQDIIQCIMVVHAVPSEGESSVCIYPPTPQNSLFFYIDDPIKVQPNGYPGFIEQPRSVVVGPQLTRVKLDIQKSHKAVRVGFHPGGLHRLLGISLSSLADRSFDAADIFGGEMKELEEQLQEAGSFDSIRDCVEAFLLRRCRRLKALLPFDKAMLGLLSSAGNRTMEETASLACLSLRQFERVSQERIGTSPKFFARLARFSKAYRIREKYPDRNWTDITYDCGYFDQMHLIRDFKLFAGMTPRLLEQELLSAPARLQADLRL